MIRRRRAERDWLHRRSQRRQRPARVGAQHIARSGEQRPECAAIGRAGLQALGDDVDGAVDGDDGIIAWMTTPPRVGWMRLLGSVKLRWARSGGPPSAPRSVLPLSSCRRMDPVVVILRRGCLASASSAALAARMRSSRAALLATQSGISSPRLSYHVTIFRRIGGLGVGKPSRDLGGSFFSASRMRP